MEVVDSFKSNKFLNLVFYIIFFDLVLLFQEWYKSSILSETLLKSGEAVCPPYFQNCKIFYLLDSSAPVYTHQIFIMLISVPLFLSLFYFINSKFKIALYLLLVPILFKFFYLYFLNYNTVLNYNYLTLIIAILLIFSKDKLFSIKVYIFFMYICSAIIKIYPSYLNGNFFQAFNGGLPILPTYFNLFYPIVVICSFIIFPTLLWHRNQYYRLTAFIYLFIFHLYTISLVGFRFPFLCIFLLIIFYVSDYEKFDLKRAINNKVLSFILLISILFQIFPYFISSNYRVTGEGERLGYYIFYTNKQCKSDMSIYYKNGEIKKSEYKYTNSTQRCDPYIEWAKFVRLCSSDIDKSSYDIDKNKSSIDRVSLNFKVSLNGSRYINVINENNICNLHYSFFTHNYWIYDDQYDYTSQVSKGHI